MGINFVRAKRRNKIEWKKKMIKIENLTCQYNAEPIFSNLDLTIEDGDYLAIIGENGSGKSSLIKMILGINQTKNNNIFIDKIPIEKYKDWNNFGYVSQKSNIPHDIPITVNEYLKLYSSDKKAIENTILNFNLEPLLKQAVNKLSGGQIQRVNIAKSLLNQIKYLILDEPNTGLDPKRREELYLKLHELSKNGLTIIIISHSVEEFKDKIHKVYNIEKQELIEVSPNDCRFC